MKTKQITDTLKSKGYEVYLVGGCVRDKLMGLVPKDIDIVTSARPDDIVEIFNNIAKVNLVGKSFGVVLVDDYEVATFRGDKYFGLDDKNCEIEYVDTIEEDLSRRDLTINSIAYDPYSEELIDPFNGIEDIKSKLVKFTGNPFYRIREDPNRIIRACRFLSKIDGEFSEWTLQALTRCSSLIKYVKPERIRVEILKSMQIEKASRFFISLYNIGCLEYIFPSMYKSYDHPHGKHHWENIFDHLMNVGDQISTRNTLLKLTGYLHDCGKPKSYTLTDDEEKRGVFYKHHIEGKYVAKEELLRLKFSNDEIKYISRLIRNHMFSTSSDKSIRKTLRRLDDLGIHWKDLVRLRIADQLGSEKYVATKLHEQTSYLVRLIDKFRDAEKNTISDNRISLAINGNDIMEILGIEPGKKVGEVKKYIEELVLEDPEMNDRDILIDKIKEFKEEICIG